MDTPGHTMCHICLRSHAERPALFSGDTLFNASTGHCHNGDNAEAMYATFVEELAKLPARPASIRAMITSRTICASRLRTSPTTPPAKALLPA